MKTNAQVKKLFEEFRKDGRLERAAMKADMSPNTARRYLKAGRLPSDMQKERDWRTRPDPFEKDWEKVRQMLSLAPELEAKAVFEYLCELHPGRYFEGQLRTFQRKVKRWRAMAGPAKNVFFEQKHRPGEAMQIDWTWCNELEVTICNVPFEHLLCHAVLPYSNWEDATICQSESFLSLQREMQHACMELGHTPKYSQTDQTSAATHQLSGEPTDSEVKAQGASNRAFNPDYVELVKHFGMEPRTIGVGCKEQNGDVEAAHRVLKARLKQHLILRGSRDFESREVYEAWVWEVVAKANRRRQRKLQEELKHMRPLQAARLLEYREERVTVPSSSIIRVMFNGYSVPSRLIGEMVKVRIWEDRLEVYYADRCELRCERLSGRHGCRIDYRHTIDSLVRKPGAFARYRYQAQLYPSLVFRKAYDWLAERLPTYKADLEYLRILKVAADTMESEVQVALSLFLEEGLEFDAVAVRQLVENQRPEIPEMPELEVELGGYDELLQTGEELAA